MRGGYLWRSEAWEGRRRRGDDGGQHWSGPARRPWRAAAVATTLGLVAEVWKQEDGGASGVKAGLLFPDG
jgi:hypothetical protein